MTNLRPIQKCLFSFLQIGNLCLHQCFVLMAFWCCSCHQKVHGEEENSRFIVVSGGWQRISFRKPQVAHLCVPSLLLTLSCRPYHLQQLQPDRFERTPDRQSRHLDFLFPLGKLLSPVTTCFIHDEAGFKSHVAAMKSCTVIPKDTLVSWKSPYLALLALGT